MQINIARATPQQVAQIIANRVHKLQRHLSVSHFAWRGTHHAVLAEAQGVALSRDSGKGQKFYRPYDHLHSLTEGREGAKNCLDRLTEVRLGVMSCDRAAGAALNESLRPLRELAESRILLADATESIAAELQADPRFSERLGGAPVTTKGRKNEALMSTQLERLRGKTWNGPFDLLPPQLACRDDVVRTLNRIEQIPLDEVGAIACASKEGRQCRGRILSFFRHDEGQSHVLTAIAAGLQRMWSPDGDLSGDTASGDGYHFSGGSADSGSPAGSDGGD